MSFNIELTCAKNCHNTVKNTPKLAPRKYIYTLYELWKCNFIVGLSHSEHEIDT